MQLVMDGMKIQPCSPGFVDGRNAILSADVALTGGANQCEIWNGFAKRGLGVSASQGSSSSRSDGVQAFDVPTACHMTGIFGPLQNDPTLNRRNAGAATPISFGLGGDQGLDVFAAGFPASQAIDCVTKAPTGPVTPAQSPGGSTLVFDASTGLYTFTWKTQGSWSGTCRMLILEFKDNSRQVAYVRFT
jgi:hypothetical protein